MSIDFVALAAPFPPDRVSWRVGTSNKKKRQRETGDNFAKATKGQALAYLDARDVMERLDDVCGPAGWQNRYTHADKKTICEIGIWFGGEWVWKADGAGDSDIEAEKGALSDAFKRAAVRWGIGRYLYDVPSPWVDLDEREQIKPEEHAKLRRLLNGFGGPAAQSRPAPEPEPEPQEIRDTCRLAAQVLATSNNLSELRSTWDGHIDGWRKQFTAAEIDFLVSAKDATKDRLTAQKDAA